MGQELAGLSVVGLNQLEEQLEMSVSKVRARKVCYNNDKQTYLPQLEMSAIYLHD